MNYVFLSPHFPPNYPYLAAALKAEGFQVLGIGSEAYDRLEPALKEALTEYYRLEDMEDQEALLRTCGYFTHRYGRIHFIESHNEHWLEAEARLRTDFNVPGYKAEDMAVIKKKSAMKEVFLDLGVPVARGQLFESRDQARSLADNLGFPLIAKPDVGVGADRTYKLTGPEDLDRFLETEPSRDYIFEEFVEGEIHTFDGLTDREGRLVFANSFIYSHGVLDFVGGRDTIYYSQRVIPRDLFEMGVKVVEAFGVRARFFHLEFFRRPDRGLTALEINVRPPGGLSLDMFNYAYDLDVYRLYAAMAAGKTAEVLVPAPYHAAYIGVKAGRERAHPPDQVQERFRSLIMTRGPVPPIFSAAMGDYAYLLRSEYLDDLNEAMAFIQETS